MSKTIYQHFRPEEKDFIDQVLNWKQFVEDSYSPKLTDFLDPRQVHILKSIVGTEQEVKVAVFGGKDGSERTRALLFPEYFNPTLEDYQITLFEINYASKFVTLNHRQILGTLMSLGLKREKFGDIILHLNRAQFFVANEISEFIKMELLQIGKASVQLVERNLDEAIETGETWQEIQTTVSSLRLDTVLSAVHNISRQKAQNLIQHGLVKVNWRIVEQPSFTTEEGDILSSRGYGRSKIDSIEGKTKKEKWRIKAGLLK